MAKEEADWFRLLFSSKHKKIDLKNEFLKICRFVNDVLHIRKRIKNVFR